MVVAEERQGQLVIIDRIREMVRLAAGLDEEGNLDKEVEKNALDCLQRFGQRLREVSSRNIAAVGTNTLRRTKDSVSFLQQAENVLGHPIEIISGIEEARLIYQGVAHSLEPDHKDKLVMDIGGGSTELIIGKDFQPRMMESLEMGCVTMTRAFFPDGKINAKRINKARIRVLQKMKPIRHAFKHEGWDVVIGASGTIKAAASVIAQIDGGASLGGIEFNSLNEVIGRIKKYEETDSIKLDGLSERRVPVFLGGVIVLAGVMEALDIEHLHVSDGALREGLLQDLIGRRHNKDIRNRSVELLASRFHVDTKHSQQIENTVCNFLDQVYKGWSLDRRELQKLLIWACEVHEIGRDIAHSGYQKHSGYIVENADMAGFSQQEKARLAVLVRAHRGKISEKLFAGLLMKSQSPVVKLAVLLRLAVIFHRSRVPTSLPSIGLTAKENKLIVKIPPDWLEKHPLTLNDIEQEAEYLKAINIDLQVES